MLDLIAQEEIFQANGVDPSLKLVLFKIWIRFMKLVHFTNILKFLSILRFSLIKNPKISAKIFSFTIFKLRTKSI